MKDFKAKLKELKNKINEKQFKVNINKKNQQDERKLKINKLLIQIAYDEIRLKTALQNNEVNKILSLKKIIDSEKIELKKISNEFSKHRKIKKVKKDEEYYLRGMSSSLGRMADDPSIKLPINKQAGTFEIRKKKRKKFITNAYKHSKK